MSKANKPPETCNKLNLSSKCKACRNKQRANCCERRKSWFRSINLNESTVLVCALFFLVLLDVCNVYAVFISFFSCVQGKRKRLSVGSYCEDDDEKVLKPESSLGEIPKNAIHLNESSVLVCVFFLFLLLFVMFIRVHSMSSRIAGQAERKSSCCTGKCSKNGKE